MPTPTADDFSHARSFLLTKADCLSAAVLGTIIKEPGGSQCFTAAVAILAAERSSTYPADFLYSAITRCRQLYDDGSQMIDVLDEMHKLFRAFETGATIAAVSATT